MRWPRHGSGDVAVGELLDAAGRAFAELGVAKVTMVDISRYAGCSRATLYRYFENRHALHLAYVNRAALAIAATQTDLPLRSDTDPVEVLTNRIISGLHGVRSEPLLATWFEPENLAVPIALSQDSEVLRALATGFIDDLHLGRLSSTEIEQRGSWLLRSIVALLAMPGTDDASERTMVATFLVPSLLQDPITEGSSR
jgi:AcrR family transcriptional regulator